MNRLIAVILVTAAGLAAQMPRGFRPQAAEGSKLESLKSTLGLSDAQVEQLKQLRKDAFTSNQSLRTQLREKHEALSAAMRSENPDGAAIAAALRDLQSLRAQVKTRHEDFGKSARALLMPQQASQLASLEQSLKTIPAARQAVALGLIAPPENAGAGLYPMRGYGRHFGAPMGARMRRAQPQVQ